MLGRFVCVTVVVTVGGLAASAFAAVVASGTAGTAGAVDGFVGSGRTAPVSRPALRGPTSAHRQAAVDADGLTGDERSVVGGEEHDRLGDLTGLGEAAHGDGSRQRVAEAAVVAAHRGEQRGVGGTGAHAVGP